MALAFDIVIVLPDPVVEDPVDVSPTILRIFANGTANPVLASNCVGIEGLLPSTSIIPACEITTSRSSDERNYSRAEDFSKLRSIFLSMR